VVTVRAVSKIKEVKRDFLYNGSNNVPQRTSRHDGLSRFFAFTAAPPLSFPFGPQV
jgi:hypothetical protein